MSYILDALRKSDQQRQRGAAPTLLAGQATVVAPKQPPYLFYGLLAAVLLGAGMVIGWLRPWQTEQAAPVAKPPELSLRQPTPARTEIAPAPEAQMHSAAPVAQIAPAPAPAPAPLAAPRPAAAPAAVQAQPRARVEASGKPQDAGAAVAGKAAALPQQPPAAPAADAAPYIVSLAELPLALQQGLPPMTISVHAYSGNPKDRMVGINNRMLREGDSVVPGLKLEQITPDGMIFGYKGYSFRRGVK